MTQQAVRQRLRGPVLARLAIVVAILCSVSVVSVAVETAQKTSAGATTTLWGDYGGGRQVGIDPNGGFWIASWTGAVTPYGGAPSFGSPASFGIHLNKPVLGMAATPTGRGYWLVASDGGIFNFGDATFYGSTGGIHLNQPIVGMAATPSGHGYWLVASDGGIFSYGDAGFYGSTGSLHLNQPIVGMAATPTGHGYWLVASDGGIFSFGDAAFHGSTGSIHLNQPIVGMAATTTGHGYSLVASDGGIFTFGDAGFYGSTAGSGKTALGLVVNPATRGYTVVFMNGAAQGFNSSGPLAESIPVSGSLSAGIGGGTQGADCQPTVQPAASVDTGLTQLFGNETGPGWLGADMGYSTLLPNGQESFVFSDTLIGTAQANGQTSITGMPNNSEMDGGLPNLETDIGGTYGSPSSLIPDPDGAHWWTGATYVENGNQLVYVNEYTSGANGTNAQFTGQSGIAVLSLSNGSLPAFSSITPIPTDANTTWGHAVVQDSSYTYIYGIDQAPGAYYGMKLARVPLGESLQTSDWTYWNGSQWVSGESNAGLIHAGGQLSGVVAQADGSGYVGVSIPGGQFEGSQVTLAYACSPQGPWSAPQSVYSIPQVSQYPNEIAYTPTFHPEIGGQGGLVVSYDINNSGNSGAVFQNDHEYQPQFLVLNG